MAVPIVVNFILLAFVAYFICRRAFIAYKNGWKSWPILALLAVAYVAYYTLRRFGGVSNQNFWIGSIVCILASRIIFSYSQNTST